MDEPTRLLAPLEGTGTTDYTPVVIIPCLDLMGGKVVQLVQGRDKALEEDDALAVLARFAAFRAVQIIDLDAAMGKGSNDDLIRLLASRAATRVGGGVRSVERARALVEQGAEKVIVGTAAFSAGGVDAPFLEAVGAAVGRDRLIVALDSRDGRVVVKGWSESTGVTAEDVLRSIEPYCGGFLCTYVDKEGMLQGTDLDWFRRLRATTDRELTAAGGITTYDDVRELLTMGVSAALGMAIYTGRLSLDDLARLDRGAA